MSPDPARAEAARLIRAHLWQPEPPGPLGGRPWTMRRELFIWNQLNGRMDSEALNGAITKLREVTGHSGPLRLTWFLTKLRGPVLLERAVHAWHLSDEREPKCSPNPFTRIHIELET